MKCPVLVFEPLPVNLMRSAQTSVNNIKGTSAPGACSGVICSLSRGIRLAIEQDVSEQQLAAFWEWGGCVQLKMWVTVDYVHALSSSAGTLSQALAMLACVGRSCNCWCVMWTSMDRPRIGGDAECWLMR